MTTNVLALLLISGEIVHRSAIIHLCLQRQSRIRSTLRNDYSFIGDFLELETGYLTRTDWRENYSLVSDSGWDTHLCRIIPFVQIESWKYRRSQYLEREIVAPVKELKYELWMTASDALTWWIVIWWRQWNRGSCTLGSNDSGEVCLLWSDNST